MAVLEHRSLYITFLLFAFYFLIGSPAMSQKPFNYDSAWKKVTAAQDKGLPKTALDAVKMIYATAKIEKQEAQQIKALVFQSVLNQNNTENAPIKSILFFEKEMKAAAGPMRSILASITADAYWNYFQQNRYKFYRRTATVNFNKDSVDTWATADFYKRIGELYATSVMEKSILQKVKLDKYEPIIIKGNARKLRPTLYDLLAHKALDYYKTEEYDVTKPAYSFTINDEAVLAIAPNFVKYKYASKDSTSLQFKAIQLFQDLIAFHQKDEDKSALVDVDIERVSWVHEKAVMEGKEQLFKEVLEEIFTQYPNTEEAMQAGYLLAVWWQQKADNYKEGGTEEDRLAYLQAIDYSKSVIHKFPKSYWASTCQSLINTITKKDIQLTVEKVNEPNKPFRALVKYRNATEVNLAIVAQTSALKNNSDENGEGYNEEKFWQTVIGLPKIKNWQQSLPATNDYRQHSVEIAIDPTALGEFYLLGSCDNKFSLDKNPLCAAMFYSSNISFVQNGKEIFMLNRSTGQPLANASIQVWASRYDYNTRKYIKNKLEKLVTDKNGYAKMQEHANEDRSVSLDINWQNDHLFLTDNINDYDRYYNNADVRKNYKTADDFEKVRQQFYFFTDRSIYRPGQWVYFKAIGITKDFNTLQSKIIQSKNPVLVVLKDANSQKLDTLSLTLNEYGSINGKFKLPDNLLNGLFSLNIANEYSSRSYFSVEEYKRPKFFVDFDKVKGSYHVNDEVKVVGNAKAYAGNKVDGAAVKYRVKRNVRFLYPWMWWRSVMPTGDEMEITNGETTTKADGTFEIVFKATPDLTLAKENDPVFDYSVEADVTDINGETRSSTTLVPVGYKALDVKITIPQNGILPADSLKNILVSSKNLSGEFEPVKADIKIYQLTPPDRLLRKRYWDAPDTVAMDYNSFIQKFPNDPYRDEQDYHSWKKGKEMLQDTLTTVPNSIFNIHHSLSQGWYVAEATAKDKFGQEVKAKEWFQLYDMKAASLPAPDYNWANVLENNVEPGEAVKIISGTSAENVFVVQQELRTAAPLSGRRGAGGEATANEKSNQQPISTISFLTLNNEKKLNTFPATEADRGGYSINQFFVKNNRVYTNNWNINVPWTNKQLDITYNTFRDKLQPGAEEKWNVTIKGSKGEKVAAEMLASMYDASLDQFKPHNWNTPNIWPTNNFNGNWNGQTNFINQDGRVRYWNDEMSVTDTKMYDQLLTLNHYQNRVYIDRKQYGNAGAMFKYAERNKTMAAGNPLAIMKKVPGMQVDSSGDIQHFVAPKVEIAKFTPPKIVADDVVLSDIINVDRNQPQADFSNVTIRKNFNETAFFFPDLHTDSAGNISFSFTMPEALTQWKLQTLAHTKNLAFGFAQKTTVTQKDLMVQPNAPRFLREGDRMEFSAKIVNLTDKEITGQSQLQLINTATNENVDGIFSNIIPNQYFTIPAGQSVAVKFPIAIPFNYNNAVSYKIVAKAGDISDGEEMAMPVLTNRMLVTESMPLNLRNTNQKDFKFEKLLNSKSSTTLSNQALTVEYTTNPTWYAVQALPYLMEFPYECAEADFQPFLCECFGFKNCQQHTKN